MKFDDIAFALGYPFDSAAVQTLVKQLAITKSPKAKSGPEAYLANKARGIELMFVDRDYMERKIVARYSNASMLLASATFYAGVQPRTRRFDGALVGGTSFDDSVPTLIAKLGAPTRVYEDDGIVYTRSWQRAGHLVSFSYSETGALQYVQAIWDAYLMRVRS